MAVFEESFSKVWEETGLGEPRYLAPTLPRSTGEATHLLSCPTRLRYLPRSSFSSALQSLRTLQ